jgi:hypothetical protein
MENPDYRPLWRDENRRPGRTLGSLWSFMGWPGDYAGSDAGAGVKVGAGLLCPEWPPDVFALTAAALRKSGAYTLRIKEILAVPQIDRIAEEWRRQVADALTRKTGFTIPDEVAKHWRIVATEGNLKLPLFRLMDCKGLVPSLIALLGIADEACAGIGLPGSIADGGDDRRIFYELGEQFLFPTEFGSTLCRYVHPSAGRVLPKMHTAQSGLTIRSFSHHLAFCETDEVQPAWLSVPGARGDVGNTHHLNILIAPWPEVVRPEQIVPSPPASKDGRPYNCFNFKADGPVPGMAPRLLEMAENAKRTVGSLDAVVMPELSLPTYDYRAARSAILRRGLLFISGVSGSRHENRLNIDVPLSTNHAVHLRQRKHHRWKIDESQVKQYGLGAKLDPAISYWEQIGVEERKLMFVVLRKWLVTTALICEDLARHDPVGELIRGIGPNLVIALLMDGPQLSGRWASRYATGLADDPGCSVLSVTSLGMAELSRPPEVKDPPSRVVALWKDAYCGRPIELAVPHGYHGLVITLAVKYGTESTADLRTDGNKASYPVLTGVHPVKAPENIPEFRHDESSDGWISPYHAYLLAQLVQRPDSDLDPRIAPLELDRLEGAAYRIGREVWRICTGGSRPVVSDPAELGADPASDEEIATAENIVKWHVTNSVPEV